MTITALEEHEETAAQQLQSEPSSPVLGLSGGQQDLSGSPDFSHEMKFEMNSKNGAQPSNSLQDRLKPPGLTTKYSLPSSAKTVQDRLKPVLATISSSSSSPSLKSSVSPLLLHHNKPPANVNLSKLPAHHYPQSRPADITSSNRSYVKDAPITNRPLPNDAADSALARTRLRRQRRMLSADQPEDPIERLNRLRARISGALSEVKGVLNKYSTELEPAGEENNKDLKSNSQTTLPPTLKPVEKALPSTVGQAKQDNEPPKQDDEPQKQADDRPSKQDDGPIQFRFVKKVRRRSVFADDDDNAENQTKEIDIKNTDSATDAKQIGLSDESKKTIVKDEGISKEVMPTIEIAAAAAESPSTEVTGAVKKADLKKSPITLKPNNNNKPSGGLRRVSIGTIQEVDRKNSENLKTQRRPSDSGATTVKLAINELKPIKKIEKVSGNLKNVQKELPKSSEKVSDPKPKGKPVNNDVPRKSIDSGLLNVNKKDGLRRSSIGTVENLKIEPSTKTQRRPSDSGAILKKSIANSSVIGVNKSNEALKRLTFDRNAKTILADDKIADRKGNEKSRHTTNIENSSTKGDIVVKQSALMPTESIRGTANETSMPSTTQLGSRLSTQAKLSSNNSNELIVNSSTMINTANTLQKTKEIADKVKDSKLLPMIALNSQKIANVEVPSSHFPQISETSSQQCSSSKENFNSISRDKKIDSLEGRQQQRHIDSYKIATTNSTDSSDDSKKLINQQRQIPLTAGDKASTAAAVPLPIPISSSSSSSSSTPLSSSVQEPSTQQVARSAELAVVIANGTDDDICMTENIEKAANKSLNEVNIAAAAAAAAARDISTKIPNILKDTSNGNACNAVVGKNISTNKEANMPELQLHPTPVKALDIQQDVEISKKLLCESQEVLPKKKILHKKFIKRNSTEKQQTSTKSAKENAKPPSKEILSKTEQQIELLENANEISNIPAEEINHESIDDIDDSDAADDDDDAVENKEQYPVIPPSRTRQIKKKVIIKRLQRRLSGSDQTFFITSTNDDDEKSSSFTANDDVETLEKAIAYVTDDEADDIVPMQQNPPLKSCMHLRVYEVGDLVLYAERFKKTQIRWKKGRIVERITSISYKVDIDGKEVSAHIKDLKKYTGRKVRFGDKEYLEIDYEQIPEEEKQTSRTYSIWNMV